MDNDSQDDKPKNTNNKTKNTTTDNDTKDSTINHPSSDVDPETQLELDKFNKDNIRNEMIGTLIIFILLYYNYFWTN